IAEEFDAMLAEPVPFKLAQTIKTFDMPASEPAASPAAPANAPRPIWGAIAASLVMLVIGGIGGYSLKPDAPVQTAGWLADIADYHAVYASQGRHLVEVGADESDHIETWLGNTIGTPFSIPDLTAFDLTFEGGRLLVANGKPVAQLMYRDPEGTVVALCLQQSGREADVPFNTQRLNGFDFVSWTANGADYVVIGPPETDDLGEIAAAAAISI
ncbi:MAG: anti-sigma factor, partial [Pseudomonadota bacterium]